MAPARLAGALSRAKLGACAPSKVSLHAHRVHGSSLPRLGRTTCSGLSLQGTLASPTPSGHLYSLGNLQPSMFFIYFPSCGVVYKGRNRRMGTPAPQELMGPPSTPGEQEVPATSTQAEAPVVPTQPDVHAASRPATPTTVPPSPLPLKASGTPEESLVLLTLGIPPIRSDLSCPPGIRNSIGIVFALKP